MPFHDGVAIKIYNDAFRNPARSGMPWQTVVEYFSRVLAMRVDATGDK